MKVYDLDGNFSIIVIITLKITKKILMNIITIIGYIMFNQTYVPLEIIFVIIFPTFGLLKTFAIIVNVMQYFLKTINSKHC